LKRNVYRSLLFPAFELLVQLFLFFAPFVLVHDGHETNPTPTTTAAAARSLHYPRHHSSVIIIVVIGKSRRRRTSSRSEEMSFGNLKKTVKVHVNVSFLRGDDTRGETTTTVQQPHDSKESAR
jgi:hypothetical protein|tara:strand:- start:201 stop:569 length:369 start_codon:yes stop_codon:yes gene_type:complete